MAFHSSSGSGRVWFEMTSLGDRLMPVEHRRRKCQPIMRWKWGGNNGSADRESREVAQGNNSAGWQRKGGLTVVCYCSAQMLFLWLIWLEKSPWGVETIMAFVGCEIWSFWIARALEKLSFCGLITEELLVVDAWPLLTKLAVANNFHLNWFVGKQQQPQLRPELQLWVDKEAEIKKDTYSWLEGASSVRLR